MKLWQVIARDPIGQSELAKELNDWLNRERNGLRLFREGATICDLGWAHPDLITHTELESVWMVRLFCAWFELFARRRGYQDPSWQLRIVCLADEVPEGQRLSPAGKTNEFILLGEQAANGFFVDRPNRYRRALLQYPISDQPPPKSTCRLHVRRFQLQADSAQDKPDSGALISCWCDVTAVVTKPLDRAPNESAAIDS